MANYLLTQTGEEVQGILNQAPETEAGLQQEVTNREQAITAEQQAREQAIAAEATAREQAIAAEATARQQAIAAEATARADADDALDTKIDAETTRAEGAEQTLTDAIAQEVTDRTAAVAAEATARQQADTAQQQALAQETSRAQQAELANAQAISTNAQALQAEANTRQNADTVLQDHIDDEEERAKAAEATLQSNIDALGQSGGAAVAAERERAQAAESTLDGKIDAETTRAEAAEGTLNDAIAKEVTARQQAVTAEATARADADAALQTAINGKQDTIADLADIRSGAAAGATAYQKPATGIPATDMSSDVQTSLDKADTALQEHQSLDDYYTKSEVDNLITTPDQEYVSVTATAQTTAVTDVLPATGAADTLYRVGNWDGTQYDPTMYALFAWNGTTYVCLAVRSFVGEVYDVSVNHPDGQGNPTPYADLTAALGTDGANIPVDIRRGGMSIIFIQGTVQSSDNKYVQFRLMSDTFNTTEANWQGVDDVPTAGSENLVKSGGAAVGLLSGDEQKNINVGEVQTGHYYDGNLELADGNGKYYSPVDVSSYANHDIIIIISGVSSTSQGRCLGIIDADGNILERTIESTITVLYGNIGLLRYKNIPSNSKYLYISFNQNANLISCVALDANSQLRITTASLQDDVDSLQADMVGSIIPLSIVESSGKYYVKQAVGTQITSESEILTDGSGKYLAINLSDYAGKKLKFRIDYAGSQSSTRGIMLVVNGAVTYSAYENTIKNQDILLDIPTNAVLYESHRNDSTFSAYIISTGLSDKVGGLQEDFNTLIETDKTCYVAPNGNDSNNGSLVTPFATISHAISEGYKSICVKAGTYNEKINVENIDGLSIFAYDVDTYDGNERKRPIITNGTVYNEFVSGTGYKSFAIGSTPQSYTDVFVNHSIEPIIEYQGFRNTFNAGLWAQCSDKYNDFMFKPVLTLEELSENNTFFYDGTNVYFNTDAVIEGVVVVGDSENVAHFLNCNNLKLSGLDFEYAYNDGVSILASNLVNIENCSCHHSLRRNNWGYTRSDLRFTNCLSYKAKRDGFNAAWYGVVVLDNCKSVYNYDDGESSHEYCEIIVIGGEYAHNGKAGHAPVNGCKFSCNGTYSHDNYVNGLLRSGGSGYSVLPYLISNSVFINNGTDIVTDIDINMMNCKYVTKTGDGTIHNLTE